MPSLVVSWPVLVGTHRGEADVDVLADRALGIGQDRNAPGDTSAHGG
ncbi:hypothetical protein V1J52_24485 [Streptomyces sp. TRM 70351]|nr:hypothetical protein [Streptomyces sp. TRM 70351]MEE1931290.1 hypothetical protein [Streptomyces sp. TRM 70351]